MHVSHLSLRDFRSYPAAELALAPGVTTLIGPNGAGKTNLIEALGYAATLGSHRAAADAPLVRAGAANAVVRAAVVQDARTALIEIEITPGRANRARLNRSPVSRVRDVAGLLRTVLFSPEDLALVKGDPAERRHYLDDLLTTRTPRWAGVSGDYDRVLKQRNALLKSVAGVSRSARSNLPTLDVWDGSLASLGARIVAARLDLVALLEPLVQEAYTAVAGVAAAEGTPSGVRLDYQSKVDGLALAGQSAQMLEKRLLEALAEGRSADIERGTSSVGPHRDELLLAIRHDLPARGYASHGESWSLALALRLASYRLLQRDGGEPVLILDDVFAELDSGRRTRLAQLLDGAEQVLITAADGADVPASLSGRCVEVPADVAA